MKLVLGTSLRAAIEGADAGCHDVLADEPLKALIAGLSAQVGADDDKEAELVLECQDQGLSLLCEPKRRQKLRVDFVGGAQGHRRRFGGGRGQLIAKACGLKGGRCPTVLDAMAGLGRDGFVLAQLGCSVDLIERSPWVAALLADGLRRAAKAQETAAIVGRMSLKAGEAETALEAIIAGTRPCPQVIYLDPMFPPRRKAAKVRLEMQLLHRLITLEAQMNVSESRLDEKQLLDLALATGTQRVVVKRARHDNYLAQQPPRAQLIGKSSRFDLYW